MKVQGKKKKTGALERCPVGKHASYTSVKTRVQMKMHKKKNLSWRTVPEGKRLPWWEVVDMASGAGG